MEKEKGIAIGVLLEPAIKARFETASKRNGRDMSKQMRVLIYQFVKEHEAENGK